MLLYLVSPQGGIPYHYVMRGYKKINDNFILINNNKPSYTSKLEATKDFKISNKTISKYLGGTPSPLDYQ